jgi:glycerophosphoryl diester phosphodiesterase
MHFCPKLLHLSISPKSNKMKPPRQTLIFAHRGANREAAENTRAAFDRALTYPIDGMETDIQLSRDAVAVLWHDRFLGKLGHPEKHIDDFDYDQLQAMNFAQHFAPDAQREGIVS